MFIIYLMKTLVIRRIAAAQHGTDDNITCVCQSVGVSVVAPTAAIFIPFS